MALLWGKLDSPLLPLFILSCSVLYMVTPLYVAEVTPKDSRGFLISIIGVMYSVGIIFALGTNIGFAKLDIGWRVTFAVSAVMGLVYTMLLKLIPRSPR